MVTGGTVLLIGIAMILLPGPAFLVIPAGLAILAVEFAWAKRLLRSAKAVLRYPKATPSAPRKKITVKSIRRSLQFLNRQLRHAVWPKKKTT